MWAPPAASSADVRGPDAALNGLACATGGQYVFVARPDHFRDRDVRSRLVASPFGAWHADVSMTPLERLPRGPALLSTVFRAEVGEAALYASLAAPPSPGAPDTRVFVTPWR